MTTVETLYDCLQYRSTFWATFFVLCTYTTLLFVNVTIDLFAVEVFSSFVEQAFSDVDFVDGACPYMALQ